MFSFFQVKKELELVRLQVSSAMGAAWLAAKLVKYDLPRDDSAFCDVFYTYRPATNGTNEMNGTKGMNGKTETNGNGAVNCKVNNLVNGDFCGCHEWTNWS